MMIIEGDERVSEVKVVVVDDDDDDAWKSCSSAGVRNQKENGATERNAFFVCV